MKRWIACDVLHFSIVFADKRYKSFQNF